MAKKKSNWVVVGKNSTGTSFIDEAGKSKKLLTPHGKGKKYARELSTGIRETNMGSVKKNEKGQVMTLTEKQRAYRSGYLDAQKDSAKAYKAKNK